MKNRERERETWPLTLRLMWADWSVGFLSSSWFVTPDILLSCFGLPIVRFLSLQTELRVCVRERVKGFLLSFFFSSLPTPFYRKVKRWVFLGDQIDGSDVLGGIHPTDSRYSRNRLCFWAWVVFPLFTLLGFRAKILSPSLVSPNEAWVNT